MAEECQLTGTRCFQGCQTGYQDVGVTMQFPAQRFNDRA
jgi:hypothetical protein